MEIIKAVITASILMLATSANSATIDILSLDRIGEVESYTGTGGSSQYEPGNLYLYTVHAYSGASSRQVEAFLDLPNEFLEGVDGSAVKGSVNIQKGQVLSLDWSWSSSERLREVDRSIYNDFAFITLTQDTSSIFQKITDLSDMPFDSYAARNYERSGTFSWAATSSGVLNFGIGVLDVEDGLSSSEFVIKSINLTPVSAVPEPSTYALMLGGLGLVGFMARHRRKQA